MSTEYLKLAVGNLAHRKTRSVLTMIGIIITLVILGCIFGLLEYWVHRSPIKEPIKTWVHWALLTLICPKYRWA